MNLRSNVAPVVMVAGDFKKVQSTDIQSLIQSRHLFTLYATSLPTSVSLSLGCTSTVYLLIYSSARMPIHITVKRYGETQKGRQKPPSTSLRITIDASSPAIYAILPVSEVRRSTTIESIPQSTPDESLTHWARSYLIDEAISRGIY